MKEVYETIMLKNKITLRPDIVEKFILKVISVFADSFEKIEEYLLLTGTNLTQRIIEKIFIYFGAVRLVCYIDKRYIFHFPDDQVM
jgi:hypothetical protein